MSLLKHHISHIQLRCHYHQYSQNLNISAMSYLTAHQTVYAGVQRFYLSIQYPPCYPTP